MQRETEEPLNLPDKLDGAIWPLSTRWFYHVVLSLLLGSHATVIFELLRRKRLWTRHDASMSLSWGIATYNVTRQPICRSRSWYSVTSRTLANSLMRHFNDRWSDYGTITIEQMLRLFIPRNVTAHGSERVWESLDLSVETVQKYAESAPLLILLVGKPGSGKTSAARTLVQRLNSSTLPAYHVSDLEFVRETFRRAITTADGTVEATADGGYHVLGPRIWDAADEHIADVITKLPAGTLIGIVELARKSYQRTLDRLSARGIRPDLVAYLDSTFELAHKRNLIRRDFDQGHYVSESEMEASYREDDYVAISGRVETSRIEVEQSIESVAAEIYTQFRDSLDRRFLLRRT